MAELSFGNTLKRSLRALQEKQQRPYMQSGEHLTLMWGAGIKPDCALLHIGDSRDHVADVAVLDHIWLGSIQKYLTELRDGEPVQKITIRIRNQELVLSRKHDDIAISMPAGNEGYTSGYLSLSTLNQFISAVADCYGEVVSYGGHGL